MRGVGREGFVCCCLGFFVRHLVTRESGVARYPLQYGVGPQFLRRLMLMVAEGSCAREVTAGVADG
jgi:hypothetical protein